MKSYQTTKLQKIMWTDLVYQSDFRTLHVDWDRIDTLYLWKSIKPKTKSAILGIQMKKADSLISTQKHLYFFQNYLIFNQKAI